jgi:hypothetical protein
MDRKKRRKVITNPEIIRELKVLARKGRGLLTPAAVVDAARNQDSALHNSFTWDDGQAAHAYRLEQARTLLQVTVEYLPAVNRSVRVFVSLAPDRQKEEGGYRSIVHVLADKDNRAQLLADALAELTYFRAKYGMLKELAGVWREVSKLVKD